MGKFTEEQIQKGLDKAYKEVGHNAYFGNGFKAGVEFAMQGQSLPIDNVSICLTKEEESKQIEAISSIIRGLAKDNSIVAIGAATIRILNAFTRSINRC